MRLPNNIDNFSKKPSKSQTNSETITISVNEKSPRYNVEIFYEEKAKIKFIKRVEKIVRSSYEYGVYINDILKGELDIKQCAFLPNINIEEIKAFGLLEFHHYPLTLYDIVEIELNKIMESGQQQISPYLLASRVVELHFKNLVGLVPLSVTVHDLFHEGQLFINKKYCISNLYEEYIKRNEITEELKEKLNQLDYLSTRENNGENINGSILNLKTLNIISEDEDREITFNKIAKESDNAEKLA
jgi:hypothetical protein